MSVMSVRTIFADFKANRTEVISVAGKPFLALFGPTHILVQQGSGKDVIIEIDAVKANDFSIEAAQRFVVVGAPRLDHIQFADGLSVSDNFYTNDGRDPVRRYPRLRITVPDMDSLQLKTSEQSAIEIEPRCSYANITLSGLATLKLNTGRLHANLSGQAELNAAISRTDLEERVHVRMCGQAELTATGDFGHVKIEAAGQAEAKTIGDVAGNYVAIASDRSEITHRGNIAGERTNQKSGQASIKLG